MDASALCEHGISAQMHLNVFSLFPARI